MADESSSGMAYLLALRQSSGAPGTAAAPAPAVEQAGSVPTEQFQGAEKRRSPRYKCEGSAEMQEEGCDVHTWATFTDVSLHGCYVEAQATYPVNTKLHLKLQGNGIRVESKAIVRVNYPYLGMGIAFVEMSEDNRARLRELLGTLSHPTVIMGPGIVSSQPSAAPMEAVPPISDPEAAIQRMVAFFESHHMMTRDDFLKTLKHSQK